MSTSTCNIAYRHAWEGAEQGAKLVKDVKPASEGEEAQHFTPRPAVLMSAHSGKEAWVGGDPGSYGLLCFGMTTCMLMFVTTRWAESSFLPTVFCYAFFYGGLGQFVAGVLELIRGSTFSGTAFASYGSFWMGWFLLEKLTWDDKAKYPLATTGKTLWCGLWAFLTFGFFIVTLRKNGCLMTIFFTLVITFALLAGGVWDARVKKAAGYFGFFCGSSAIYAALAFLYEKELGRKLPGVRPVDFLPAVAVRRSEHCRSHGRNSVAVTPMACGRCDGGDGGDGCGGMAVTVGAQGKRGVEGKGKENGKVEEDSQSRGSSGRSGRSGTSGGSSGDATAKSGAGGVGGAAGAGGVGSGAGAAGAGGDWTAGLAPGSKAPSQSPLPPVV